MTFVFLVLIVALAFEYMNGFNDSANAIATSIATRALTAAQAVALASICDLLGALAGTAVAKTVAAGLVDPDVVTQTTILCALLAAILWGSITWRFGIPSSSSHALIGGLVGAALATAHGHWSVIKWSVMNPQTHKLEGLQHKVIVPMFATPIIGLVCGFIVMGILLVLIRPFRPDPANRAFLKLQIGAAAWTSFTHGMNDAQKTMGVIALTLFTATRAGHLDGIPAWLSFLRNPNFEVSTWIKVMCAITIATGIATGGQRIIKTVGKKLTRLLPIHGFVAQATSAGVIQVASVFGMPLSTTHVVSSIVMGVGATRRMSAVKWSLLGRLVWAWVMTIPITASIGYAIFHGMKMIGIQR